MGSYCKPLWKHVRLFLRSMLVGTYEVVEMAPFSFAAVPGDDDFEVVGNPTSTMLGVD